MMCWFTTWYFTTKTQIIQSQRKSRAVLAFVLQQHSKPALLLALYEITILVTYTQLCSLMQALLYCILIYNVKSSAGFIFTSATSKSQHCSWHCTRIQYLYRTTLVQLQQLPGVQPDLHIVVYERHQAGQRECGYEHGGIPILNHRFYHQQTSSKRILK